VYQQGAQVAITALTDSKQNLLIAATMLAWHHAKACGIMSAFCIALTVYFVSALLTTPIVPD
jgi:hypothetical protein